MAWNMPSYNTDNYTFGPCIVYIGATGTTPVTDIGAVKGNTEVTVNKEILEISQGSPRVVTKQYVTVQGAMISLRALNRSSSRTSKPLLGLASPQHLVIPKFLVMVEM